MAKKSKPVVKKVSKNDQRRQRVKQEKDAIERLQKESEEFELTADITRFDQLPLSESTLKGLKASHFIDATDIQRKAIVPALVGKDVLGAARTGSGKTLAFLIPVLETLYRRQWNTLDGLGALIVTPTRELAIQIFEVLRKIGRSHTLSAGLVIGGKDPEAEAVRVSKLNILIGTPGRIVHHMHKSSGFDTSNLQMLVLDEADRILDMGFKKEVNAIVQDLPPERQTLLFSATQTKSVSDLARLSLDSPEYISAHEENSVSTPKNLEQFYVLTEVPDKLNTLFSFLRSHLTSKILVFFASSKQVRFVYETFRKMKPGIPLLHLHGKQKQTARIEVTSRFSSDRHCCLFATDIVARGIDFPAVDWVIQVDAPEDAATYIHRVGRSARFDKKGKALLFLTPKEEPGMVEALEGKKVPITKLNIRESKKKSIVPVLQKLCFDSPEIKYLGQKAFISYVRSVFVQHHKHIFNVEDIPMEQFATSLGLLEAPRIKIHGRDLQESIKKAKQLKNTPRGLLALSKGEDSEEKKEDEVRTKYDRMFGRKNQGVLSEHYMKLQGDAEEGDEEGDDSDEEGGLMTVKRQDHNIDDGEVPDLNAPVSKRQAKRALSKKVVAKTSGDNPKKLVFDEEGNAHEIYEFEGEDDFRKAGDSEAQKKKFLDREQALMEKLDVEDKQLAKDKRQEKKRRRREMLRAEMEDGSDDEGYEVTLGGGDDDDGDSMGEPDLDRDMEHSSDDEDERPAKKARWFDRNDDDERPKKNSGVLEVEQPDTLEDLEALSTRLLRK